MTFVEFECRGHRFAVPLHSVRKVVPSAKPTPLPGAPDIVLGVLNVGGEVVVLINFYRRVGLPFPGLGTSHQLLVVDIGDVCVALIVDQVSRVVELEMPHALSIPGKLAADNFVATIIKHDDGVCVVCDPQSFLLGEEKIALSNALERTDHVAH